MNVFHNALQLFIHLGRSPLQAHGILTHFKSRYSHTTSVGSLTGPIKDLTIEEDLNGFRSRRHVGALCHTNTAVVYKRLGIAAIQFVLSGAWQSNITFGLPWSLVLPVFSRRILLQIFFDTTANGIFQHHHMLKLLRSNALCIINGSVAV